MSLSAWISAAQNSPWLAVAVGFPLVNAVFLTVVITLVKTIEYSADSFRYTEFQKVYANALFKVGVAALFVVVGPVSLGGDFRLVYLGLFVVGAGMYVAENKVWQWYAGTFARSRKTDFLLLAPLVVLPFAEEIIYRGGIAPLVGEAGTGVFVGVSAALFGVDHLYNGKKEFAFKLFDGVVYALLFVATGSVLATAIAHVGYNAAYVYRQSVSQYRKLATLR